MTAPAAVLAHWPQATGLVATPLPSGHINDTWIVGDNAFVLQRINRRVFANPAAVMRNLARAAACDRRVVAPLANAGGARWHTDALGETWRLFPCIAGARSFARLPASLVEPAAQAFGAFHAAAAKFEGEVEMAIAGFHRLPGYLEALQRVAAGKDTPELRYVRQRRNFEFPAAAAVIHGDCKVNNLLFHAREPRVIHLIDLDTVMRGHPAWDFGDLVRSVACGAEEAGAAPDISLAAFRAVAAGFARGAGGIAEPSAFAAAPGHMSFMLGVRFLADHYAGDRYFKVSHRGQNLQRARSQLEAARRCDALQGAFEQAIASLATNAGCAPAAG